VRDLTILFRDDELVAVDKPAGLLVHRTKESSDRTFLLQRLRDQLGQHVYPIHRLDRPASGVILFGLSPAAARHCKEQWDDARKEYLAFVRGETPRRFASDRELTSDRGVKQEAHTEFATLCSVHGFSLVRARLRTGRRHQIRRHLAHLGHQIVGDTQHGKGGINRWLRAEFGLPRLFLHARRLALGAIDVRAPLPEDLRSFLRAFGARDER